MSDKMSEVVYVLKGFNYYGFGIFGVFTSREKAYHAMKRMGEGYRYSVAPYPFDVINSDIKKEFDNE